MLKRRDDSQSFLSNPLSILPYFPKHFLFGPQNTKLFNTMYAFSLSPTARAFSAYPQDPSLNLYYGSAPGSLLALLFSFFSLTK